MHNTHTHTNIHIYILFFQFKKRFSSKLNGMETLIIYLYINTHKDTPPNLIAIKIKAIGIA